MDNRDRGRRGERLAAEYLVSQGYTILACNYSCRVGEIDIIAEKGNIVAFVEVKLRKNAAFADAREFVTPAKQKRIIATAGMWLSESDCRLQVRFDVMEIYCSGEIELSKAKINHIQDAFQ